MLNDESFAAKPLRERLLNILERHLGKPRHPLAQLISSFQAIFVQ